MKSVKPSVDILDRVALTWTFPRLIWFTNGSLATVALVDAVYNMYAVFLRITPSHAV